MHVVPISVPQLATAATSCTTACPAWSWTPPGRDRVENAAADLGVTIVAVAETHLHNDYVSGGPLLARRHHADYLVSAEERVDVERVGVRDGDVVPVGHLRVEVLDTPGHTLHHQSFHVSGPHPATPGALFSGGSLLLGTVGRTDLVDRLLSRHLARAQWESARRLGGLGAETTLHPTHGFGSFCAGTTAAPESGATVGAQRLVNAALRQDRDAFVDELVDGFGPVPAYYRRMAPLNRAGVGAAPPIPPRPLTAVETAAVQRVGGWVVDVRSAEDHVAGRAAGLGQHPVRRPVRHLGGLAGAVGSPTRAGRTVGRRPRRSRARPAPHRDRGHRHPRARAALPAPGGLHRRVTWADHAERAGRASAHDDRVPVLLDVRQRDEVEAGPPARRAAHPPAGAAQPVHSLPHGELWVHCRSGFRAGIAASLIARTGRPVVHVDDAWANVEPVVAPGAAPPLPPIRTHLLPGSSRGVRLVERSPVARGPSTSCAEESWASRAVASRPTSRTRPRDRPPAAPPGRRGETSWVVHHAGPDLARINSLRAGAPMPHPGRSARQGPCSVERSVT